MFRQKTVGYPGTVDASCGFYQLDTILSSFQQVCENHTCCNLIFATLVQVVKHLALSLWIKILDNYIALSLRTTCVTYLLTSSRINDANASRYQLNYHKATCLQQTKVLGKLGNIVAKHCFLSMFCHVSHRGQTKKHLLRNISSHES